MTRYFRRGRSVTATLREDGTTYFDVQRAPLSAQVLDWILVGLWLLAGTALIAAIFWI